MVVREPSAGEWLHRKPGSPYWYDADDLPVAWADNDCEQAYYQVDVWSDWIEASTLPESQWSVAAGKSIGDLKARMSIYDVLERYGVGYKTVKDRVRFCCPFHDDSNPSMDFWSGIKAFKCWSCGATGDIIDLNFRLEQNNKKKRIEKNG